LLGAPIYLPNDPAIPAKGSPAKSHFTRTLIRDKSVLQREYVGGPLWISLPAYFLLLAIAALWLVAIGVGLGRVGDGGAHPRRRRETGRPSALAPSGGPA
jgi:hypothetical protein